ncbi:GumC family protein [Vibrio hippocampi]|nr:polysaccharide biosynthesis tyrosine autokinase [Vibrio hippocampi]
MEDKKNQSEQVFDLYPYVKQLKRSWFLILLFSAFVTGIAVFFLMSIPAKYTATATLLIEAKDKKAVSIQQVVGIDSSQKEYYQTQFEILRSNQIAENVIDKLELASMPEFNPALRDNPTLLAQIKSLPKQLISEVKASVKQYTTTSDASIVQGGADELAQELQQAFSRKMILDAVKSRSSIIPVKNTQLVKIQFTSEDPKLAAEIANAIGYAYIDINLEARLSATQYASSWLTSRLDELKSKLEQSEQALSDFLIQEKLIDDSGIDQLASQELLNLTKRLALVRDQRIELEAAYAALRSSNSRDLASLATIPSISAHPQVISIRQAESSAINDVQRLSKRYGPKHDLMIQANAKLNAVQNQAAVVTKKLVSGMGKELQAVRKQEVLITSEIESQKNEFQSITLKKSRYQELKREIETNRNILNVFLTREKETTATSNFDSANARFTDMAMIPPIPSGPKKGFLAMATLVGSLAFAVAMVCLFVITNTTIDSVRNFEDRFGFMPIGGVPNVKFGKYRKQPIDAEVQNHDKGLSFSESLNAIRTTIRLNEKNRQTQNKTIVVTSSLQGEGKTAVSVNLAISFAKIERTLLIDCDLRKPAVADRFGFKKFQQGLSNHLVLGTPLEECLYTHQTSGLTVLPAGKLTTNPQELLNSAVFERLLSQMAEEYDRIIIDTPPTLPVEDSRIICQLADSTLVVTRANFSKEQTVMRTITKLRERDIAIEGVIVNRTSHKKAESEYLYGDYGYTKEEIRQHS